jgi:acyl carrier protein
MKPNVNSQEVRDFLVDYYRGKLSDLRHDVKKIPPDFDLLTHGIIDSLGFVDMISAVENRFQVTIDLEGLDAQQVTVLGPLCDYIERVAVARGPSLPDTALTSKNWISSYLVAIAASFQVCELM